jgi:hypothetical protein
MKLTLKNVDIAIVDTDQHALAYNALFHSTSQIQFANVLVFSDNPEKWTNYDVVRIPKILSIDDYNFFILEKLVNYITSDFVLIIQYDGFVLNPELFDSKFFEYDYIGAPWPDGSDFDVGNGGFSLRSKKLLRRVASLSHHYEKQPEDVYICKILRPTLEQEGMIFAPRDCAARFSVEFPRVTYSTFGFHGIFNLPEVYRTSLDFLINHLSDESVRLKYQYLYPPLSGLSPLHARLLLERVATIEKNRVDPAALISR